MESDSENLVTGINVISIYVSDLDRAREFYCDKLGLRFTGQNGPGIMLTCGECAFYVEPGRTEPLEPSLNTCCQLKSFRTKPTSLYRVPVIPW